MGKENHMFFFCTMPECNLSSTKVRVVQTSDMGKENHMFSFAPCPSAAYP